MVNLIGKRSKLAKGDIGNVRAVWADFDPERKLEEAGKFSEERARIAALSNERLADPDAPASAAVDSGGGHQVIWKLHEKLPDSECRVRCEDQNRGISRRFGGDPMVTPVCQILRLPGTVNFPNAKKRARGRLPARATLLARSDGGHTLEQLGEWIAPIASVDNGGGNGQGVDTLPIDWALVHDCADYGDLPEDLRRKFESACGRNSTLQTLWQTGEGGPGRKDESRSGGQNALVSLLRHYGFSPLDYAQLYSVWEFHSEKRTQRDIGRAWNRSLTPIGGDTSGFEDMSATIESRARLTRGDQPAAVAKPAFKGGYADALAYVDSEAAPDSNDEPSFEAAAAIVATELRQYDITGAQAVELLRLWEMSNGPGYADQFTPNALLRVGVLWDKERAARGASLPPTNSTTGSAAVSHAATPPATGESPEARPANDNKRASSFFTPLTPFEPSSIPPRPWIIPGFVCRGVVTMLAGPAGVAKTTWTLQAAVGLAAGRSDVCGFKIPKRQRVAVWNQEDDIDELKRRVTAIMLAFDVSWDDLKDENGRMMLSLDSGVEAPFMLANRTAEGTMRPGKDMRAFIDSAKAQGIDVLVLDPLAEMHEAGENDNVQMRSVLGYVRQIAKEAGCAAIVATHTKKPDKAKSDSFAGDMDSARGASSQVGVIRIGATIYNAGKTDSQKWEFDGSPLDYVRIDIAKNNLGKKSREPLWFKYDGVSIGFENESIGILRPATLKQKGAVAVVSPDFLEIIAATIVANRATCDGRNFSQIAAHMSKADLALFPAAKHRAEAINAAFDGNVEHLTVDFGKLTREKKGANVGWTYSLAACSPVPVSTPPEQLTR